MHVLRSVGTGNGPSFFSVEINHTLPHKITKIYCELFLRLKVYKIITKLFLENMVLFSIIFS